MLWEIEGLEMEVDDYVIKPFKIDDPRAGVNSLIRSSEKLKERLTGTKTPPNAFDILGWGDSPFAKYARPIMDEHSDNENFSVIRLVEVFEIERTALYSGLLQLTCKVSQR